MLIARTPPELDAALATLRQRNARLALVPTMGALHAGHCALIDAAQATRAAVAVSIFVNPLQFGPQEDFARYPRDEAKDLAVLREIGCDLAWLPDVSAIYPSGHATEIEVAGPARCWEGAHRPGHFRGVATVVARLFGLTRPDTAYFGEKDWQQLRVVQRMVSDLLLPVTVVGVPTVREADGLALSSRNVFLTPEQRQVAPLLHRCLTEVAAALRGAGTAANTLSRAEAMLHKAGFAPDYLALVDAETLESLAAVRPPARLLAAARLGAVRLLDNIGVG